MDRRFRTAPLLSAALVLAITVATPPAGAGPLRPEPLTGPSDAPRVELAIGYLFAHAGELGLATADLAELRVTDEVPTRHNGATHVYLRQKVHGLEIRGAEMGFHFDRAGRLFHRTGDFVPAVLARAAETARFPSLAPEEAVEAAALHVGLGPVDHLDLVDSFDGTAVFANERVSGEPIPVRLVYFRIPDSDRIVLAWNLSIQMVAGSDWWELWIDAANGAEVARVNWTDHATYRVFASPKESPDDGPRTDEVDPDLAGGIASPWGWHDTNGAPGAETTLTDGNNVEACVDADANNACDAGSLPDGGASLVFQPALDLATQQPADYRPAAVVNLYYWNNVMHDVLYQYGFDEPAGNFQHNNYGRGGLGNDRVRAEAQDGSGTNNANFATPADGGRPRMQMFVWTAPLGLVVNTPAPIAGVYMAGTAQFGPTSFNLTRDVVLVDDGSGAFVNDGCCNDGNTLCVVPNWPGITGVVPAPIAILHRGQCEFGTKTVNAQNAGAAGVIIVNTQGNDTIGMGAGANGGAATIPAVSLGQGDGNLIIANLPANVTMDSTTVVGPNRDSDLDAGIIAHEYGHGLSNRLTGGPGTTGCLSNLEQMGEGWSDWMTLFLHARPADDRLTRRPIGTYATFGNRATSTGIRRYPYSTDLAVNPLTYANLVDEVPATSPHGVGTIWATMLWDVYWNLVDIYGWDADLYNGTGGNNYAFQLVVDGLKLQPCSPGFVDGRNAILAADANNYEGENACDIWRAFAKRGLGVAANQGSSNNRGDGVPDFDLPAACEGLIFSDGFGMGNTSRWSAAVP